MRKYYENFLKDNLDLLLQSELRQIKDWQDFNRNTSHMKEYYGDGKFITKTTKLIIEKVDCKMESW